MLKKKLGFSLFELIVVITIVIILSSMATIPLGWLKKLMLRHELESLCMAIDYARHEAQLKNSPCRIQFGDNYYTIEQKKYILSTEILFGYLPHSYGPPSNPTQAIDKAITFENKTLGISKDGVIQAGTIYLTDTHKKYLYALTSSVSEFSYLRKYYYNKGTWERI